MTLLEYQCVEKGSCDGSTAWLKIGGDVWVKKVRRSTSSG
jgi:hypothetical protein